MFIEFNLTKFVGMNYKALKPISTYEYIITDDKFTETICDDGAYLNILVAPKLLIQTYEKRNLPVVGNLILLILYLGQKYNCRIDYIINLWKSNKVLGFNRYGSDLQKYLILTE